MASAPAKAPPQPLPRRSVGRLRARLPRMAAIMGDAILDEVPAYRAEPLRYRGPVLQLCRLAVRLFLRVLYTGQPPGPRELAVVERIGMNVAAAGEPLEPLLHALRIGARVGWDETLDETLGDPAVSRDEMLHLAGQVFGYIDQLSSRIAEAYSRTVQETVRAQALSESALFEDVVAGRAGADRVEALSIARPRLALALAAAGDKAAAEAVADAVARRLRLRFPRSLVGQRNGLSVWLLDREPLARQLRECVTGETAVFGISGASEDLPLARAVEEAVVAARLALELGTPAGTALEFSQVYPYAAVRLDPTSLARFRASLLGPLAEKPALLGTLREYFASGRSVSTTARRVHLHRQSVIYRLRKAAQLLHLRLDDAEAMWRLETAIRTLSPSDRGTG